MNLRRNLLITIVAIAILLTSWIVFRIYFLKSPTLESILSESSFALLRPPSDIMSPGTIAVVDKSNPGVLRIICKCESAFGDIVKSKYISGRSSDIDFNLLNEGNIDLDLSLIQSLAVNANVDVVKKISLKLTNIKIIELPDEAVYELMNERTSSCIQAINNRKNFGQKTTMVKRVFKADAEYTIDFSDTVEENVKKEIVDDLSGELSGSSSIKQANKIIGKGLFWGIDDDIGLGSLQPGEQPTTGGSRDRVTDSLSTYKVEYDQISHNVSPVKQPTEMSCWISVYAMMQSWKQGKKISIDEAVEELGEPWKGYYEHDGGLPANMVERFVVVAGLDFKPPASYLPEVYTNLLIEKGPVWLVTGNGFSSHAKLLIGIAGDYSGDEAILTFIDPKNGKIVRQGFLDFIRDYEQEAFFLNENRPDVPFRIQILYFT